METKFKDVAHLYLGCEVMQLPNIKARLSSVVNHEPRYDGSQFVYIKQQIRGRGMYPMYPIDTSGIKPILRPLSDITEDEAEFIFVGILKTYEIPKNYKAFLEKEVWFDEKPNSLLDNYLGYPHVWLYLLKQGFDLFGLIESGEAIDKTTLKQ